MQFSTRAIIYSPPTYGSKIMSFGRTTELFGDLSMVWQTIDETSISSDTRPIFVELSHKVGLVVFKISAQRPVLLR